jgi:hypothetical protein
MPNQSNKSVAVLTATILNALLFLSLFVYQLCHIKQFSITLWGFDVHSPSFTNVMVTVSAFLIVVFLICNESTEVGHMLAFVCYFAVLVSDLFTVVFLPEYNGDYFSVDFLFIVLVGVFCSCIGLGMKFSIKGLFKRQYFTVANVRYQFSNNIFADDRETVWISILIALGVALLIAACIIFHPLTKLVAAIHR